MTLNMRTVVLVIAALVVAIVTAMLARNWLAAERATPAAVETAPSNEIEILIAATNLPAGRILQDGDLAWQKWPDVSLPEPYIRRSSGAKIGEFLGSVVRSGIRAAEPVMRTGLVASNERGFLAAVLTPGMRAVSIRTSATSGVSGFVFPGDRVDLLLTQTIEEEKRTSHASETILTNVRVIGVDQSTNDQQKSPASLSKTVTLELSPEQAERVALAAQLGDLALSLRSLADTSVESGADANLAPPSPAPGTTYTWDSDISRVLSRGGASGPSIQVSRGAATQRVYLGGAQ